MAPTSGGARWRWVPRLRPAVQARLWIHEEPRPPGPALDPRKPKSVANSPAGETPRALLGSVAAAALRFGMVKKNKARRRKRRWAKAGGWKIGGQAAPPAPAAPDAGGGNSNQKAGKKGLSRSEMKAEKSGSWVPTIRRGDGAHVGTRVSALREAEKAELRASGMTAAILNRVVQLPDNECTFYLKVNCTVDEYNHFLHLRHLHYLRIAPFTVPVVINGKKVQVPVTPMKPTNVEHYTYHTVVLWDPADGTQIRLLVEDFSGYIKAFQIVLRSQNPSTKKWHRLGNDPLPSRYTHFHFTDYGDGYTSLVGVYFNCGMFWEMFEFFLSFDTDESQNRTTKGERILNTTYIAFGEAPRFPQAKLWVAQGLLFGKGFYHLLPSWLSGLIHDWRLLSMAIFSLFVALLEERLGNRGTPTPDASKSMRTARQLWSQAQVKHENFIVFFHRDEDLDAVDTPIKMEDLCGSQLTLLRHDYLSWNRAQLRLSGYTGYFQDDIEDAYTARKLT